MWIERFESRYVDLSRVLLLIALTSAFVGFVFAVGHWGQVKLSLQHFVAEDQFVVPPEPLTFTSNPELSPRSLHSAIGRFTPMSSETLQPP